MTLTQRHGGAAGSYTHRPAPGRIFGRVLIALWLVIAVAVLIDGLPYYVADRAERVYTDDHAQYAPTGTVGHPLGYIGALCIVIGVAGYVARKRLRRLQRVARLSTWLQVHIFLCTMGAYLVLLHTSFKFHGLAAISFWSMVAAVVSGMIGRYIYVRIPKSLNGGFHSLSTVESELAEVTSALSSVGGASVPELNAMLERRAVPPQRSWAALRFAIHEDLTGRSRMRRLRRALRAGGVDAHTRAAVLALVRERQRLAHQLALIVPFQRLFRYWHVVHLPVAILMFVMLAVHVAVAIAFGYAWPF